MTAKKKTTPKKRNPRTLAFEKLTVGEMMFLLGDVCDAGFEYIKYGTNIKAAYNAIRKNEDHFETLQEAVDLRQDPKVPDEMIKAVLSFVDMPENDVKYRLNSNFSHALKNPKTKKDKEEEYKVFLSALKKKITYIITTHNKEQK